MASEVILITGYLGAGKTTTLKHLLENLPKNITAAAIINERASKALDGEVIQTTGYPVKQLANGCVCCDKKAELEEQIQEVIKEHNPQLLFIETTGVAEPEPLVQLLREHQLRAILTVIDAQQYKTHQALGDTTKRQIRFSNAVLINKTDRITAKQEQELRARIQEINPKTTIYSAEFGRIQAHQLTNLQPPKLPKNTKTPKHTHASDALTIHDAYNQELEKTIQELPKTITRIKGHVQTPKGQKSIHYAAGLYSEETSNEENPALILLGNIPATTRIALLNKFRPPKNTTSYLKKNASELLKASK